MKKTIGGGNEKKITKSIDGCASAVYTYTKDHKGGSAMPSQAKKDALKRYEAKNTAPVYLKLNKKTDADVIERLAEVGNKQGYIKRLIREDIEAEADTE